MKQNTADTATPTYRAGDVVSIKLNDIWATLLENTIKERGGEIIAHEPAPKPVVWWCNVYDNDSIGSSYNNENSADETRMGRIAKLKITIVGKLVTADVVPVVKP